MKGRDAKNIYVDGKYNCLKSKKIVFFEKAAIIMLLCMSGWTGDTLDLVKHDINNTNIPGLSQSVERRAQHGIWENR